MKATATSAIVLAAAPACLIPAFADTQRRGLPFEIETAAMIRQPLNAPPAHLTPRQREVLSLLCEGLSNKLISRRLNIAGTTVKIHISGILRALNVASRLQAVIAARRLGLAGEPAPGRSVQPVYFAPAKQPLALRILLNGVSAQSPAAAADASLAEAAG